tara:strand:- start:2531 stop:3835 length:1305 start_codon:yes stop_codon:yes gene_type:complete
MIKNFKPDKIKISVVGLGYVGLPLALEFNKQYDVLGFDIDNKKVELLSKGIDKTQDLSSEHLHALQDLKITTNEQKISNSNIYIITVPTPIDKNNKPNLNPIKNASELVGSYLKKNDIVVYESTVFPGCTRELCVPILEQYSKLSFNNDFFCGYSPERINPGDKNNTLTTIDKIVSGSNEKVTGYLKKLYSSIISADIHTVSSIEVAEAAKVIENTQRDVNIALMNELAIICNLLQLNTKEVLDAAATKWNFLPFKPGLVGGHCIGVDPYYLTYKALEIGYHPEMILAGRQINDKMSHFIAEKTILELTRRGVNPVGAKVAVLGLTFKENCSDLRNSKVFDLISKLKEYQCSLSISDYCADAKDVKNQFGVDLVDIDEIKNQDVLIFAVEHEKYHDIDEINLKIILKSNGIIIDIKSIYDSRKFDKTSYSYWSL